jgi:sugar lactone lactonase YvrE
MKTTIPASLLLLSFACFNFAVGADLAAPAVMPIKPATRPFAAIKLNNPQGIAIDSAGHLYFVDVDAGKMYKNSPAGEVTLLAAGTIKTPVGFSIAPDDTVFVSDEEAGAVYRLAANGAATALSTPAGEASFNSPTNVAVDAAGNVFVANNRAHTILKITPAGVASVFAGKPGAAGAVDGLGSDARFGTPLGVALDREGNLYVADKDNSNIRKITPAGVVSTLAGTAGQSGSVDGVGAAARFVSPRALAVDAAGNVYVADTENQCVRKITVNGVVSTLAGKAGHPGKGDGMGSAARFNDPRGIAVDAAGTVYVADGGNGAIRQVTPEGVVTTIAGLVPGVAAASVPDSVPAPIVPPRMGQSERFDYSRAENFDGWDADLNYWTVKGGVFTAQGEKAPSTFLLTKKYYTDFRLTFSTQMVESKNHAGVCFWGEQTVERHGRNKWAYKGPLVAFPELGLWDYRTKTGIRVDPADKALANKIVGQNDPILVEILAQGNRVRVAYNGRQVLEWREPDPSLLKPGPIALQLHGFSLSQTVIYKDVVIESFPVEDRLITLKE